MGISLIMAKDISDCVLKEGTTLIIEPNGTVLKYAEGKFVDGIFEVEKHGSFFLTYSVLKYDSTKDKIPFKMRLPPDETVIYVSPQADKYTNDVESGRSTISITWEHANPEHVYLEYGNIFSNFIRNLAHSLRLG